MTQAARTELSVRARDVRFIKLGKGGSWARFSFENGWLSFGFHAVPHEVCAREDWDEVRRILRHHRTSDSSVSTGLGEVAAFYEMGADCLWITFAEGHLWWAFAEEPVTWLGGDTSAPSRFRSVIGEWRNDDVIGRPLRTGDLSSRLTQVTGYQGTICKVEATEYLLRRINALEEPTVIAARDAQERLISVAVEMIAMLHWADYETLVDLIFSRSGWLRTTRVGARLIDVDIVMEQPTTGETAFVQVKSAANQGVLNDYLQRFRSSGHDHFFFVCHSTSASLRMPQDKGLHLLQGRRLAQLTVRSGLFEWLTQRTG
jgi:hypothetical protein